MIGTLLGIGAAIQMVIWPHREDMIAQTPPSSAAWMTLLWIVLVLAGAWLLPSTTGSFALVSMIGAVVGAIGALFSPHPIFALIFTGWAVVYWIAQLLSAATLKAHAERAAGLR
ncbi:hypothetical protein LO762_31775 [Actinocorallia sp. API 0066]|uniref:hypothetical protein n=1 Tax=Actinocorallia sp. API 0066 TaxID=2896846 RepID=UPI001E57AEE6|nr:hypothetical protein [Actinocorallia sp. API 0066]MCD0453732.1 hypothetical protein [Actinocorallia sp. API 0066]